MVKHLIAFGHGDGDTGTTSGGRTEANAVRLLKPYLEKWGKQSKDSFSFYNGNLFKDRAMSKQKGYDTVTELHLDGPKGSGGHVIINANFKPDNIDKRLRDVIKKHFGIVGYLQKSDGFSYRTDLYNINQSRTHGINYRLLEMFFLSNEEHYKHYQNNLDLIAKEIVEAITSEKVSGKPKPVKPQTSKPKPAPTTGGSVVNYMNSKGMNSSYSNRAKLAKEYGIANYRGTASQNIELLNKLKSGAPTKPTLKSNKTVAQEVIDGKWGNNPQRSQKLKNAGYNASAIQAEVNRILQGGFDAQSIANQIKRGIDNRGRRIPNGHANRQRHFGLTSTQYAQVRRLVNK